MINGKKEKRIFLMADFVNLIVGASITILTAQTSLADEQLTEGKEKLVVNSRTASAANKPETKMMCRKIKVTGSHMKRRVCLSAEGWENLRKKTLQQLDDIRSSSPSGGGGMAP